MVNATLSRVEQLKEAGEDFEFYPTTDEIINMVVEDMSEARYDSRGYRYYDRDSGGFMDVGAGDGRVLVTIGEKLREHNCVDDLYAIEKSTIHLSAMPKDIIVVGTDFTEQTLIDKPMRWIFCNPPYSEYEEWAVKLIRESCTKYLYLVIPRRWREVVAIKHALELRGADVHSVGEFDFENADRKARAKVEVVRITYDYENTDPFDAVLEDLLPELDVFDRDAELGDIPDDEFSAAELIKGSDDPLQTLVMAYDTEVASLIDNYRSAGKIHPAVLKELGVSKHTILKGIREKIKGLKNKYWKALFDEFTPITQRLATAQREAFLKSLSNKVTIDFTEGNIYSILIWVTKWANDFFDQQLIDLFKTLSNDCSVTKYKSNEKTWGKGHWRYCYGEERTHYKLEYRLVVSHGGICTSSYSWNSRNGLEERAYNLIQDCVTVANNLGFHSTASPGHFNWHPGTRNELLLTNGDVLAAIRAYKNGNIHMHFNQRLMLAINVEAGRLLGWLRSPQEAVDELQVTGEEAEYVSKTFGKNFRIAPGNSLRLMDNSKPSPDAHHELPSDLPPPPELPSLLEISMLCKTA